MRCEVDKGVILEAFNYGRLCCKSIHKSTDRDSDTHIPAAGLLVAPEAESIEDQVLECGTPESIWRREVPRCTSKHTCRRTISWDHGLTELTPASGEQESNIEI